MHLLAHAHAGTYMEGRDVGGACKALLENLDHPFRWDGSVLAAELLLRDQLRKGLRPRLLAPLPKDFIHNFFERSDRRLAEILLLLSPKQQLHCELVLAHTCREQRSRLHLVGCKHEAALGTGSAIGQRAEDVGLHLDRVGRRLAIVAGVVEPGRIALFCVDLEIEQWLQRGGRYASESQVVGEQVEQLQV